MTYSTMRLTYRLLLVGAVVFALVGLEASAELIPDSIEIALLLGMIVPFGYLLSRGVEQLRDGGEEWEDERFREITLRATFISHGIMTLGLYFLAILILEVGGPDLELGLSSARVAVPLAVLPVVLLVGSLGIWDLSIEYYRRQM